jgi:hypothetical protein
MSKEADLRQDVCRRCGGESCRCQHCEKCEDLAVWQVIKKRAMLPPEIHFQCDSCRLEEQWSDIEWYMVDAYPI